MKINVGEIPKDGLVLEKKQTGIANPTPTEVTQKVPRIKGQNPNKPCT